MISELDLMHGYDYDGSDVSGWLMSEKLDGCRAFWDGKAMWTRGGNVIQIPAAMREQLPNFCLDGEIYAGRGNFEIARKAVQYNKWVDGIEFCVFDSPCYRGIFAKRYEFLEKKVFSESVVRIVQHHKCTDIAAALAFMTDIQNGGGEGVVLRHPDNMYRAGRTWEVLKLKEARHDHY